MKPKSLNLIAVCHPDVFGSDGIAYQSFDAAAAPLAKWVARVT
jgi:hypothetical protein